MAYRDDLETRRAHVRRLEAQLEELKKEEALVRSLPNGELTLWDRMLGGPRVYERRIQLERVPGTAELKRTADEVFSVDGRTRRDGPTTIWRGEPKPTPRRVELHLTPNEHGAELRIRDQGSYRGYSGMAGLLGGLSFFREGVSGHPVVLACYLLVAVLMLAWLRRLVRRQTRRRLRECVELEEAMICVEERRVRVETDAEEDDALDAEVEVGARGIEAAR